MDQNFIDNFINSNNQKKFPVNSNKSETQKYQKEYNQKHWNY